MKLPIVILSLVAALYADPYDPQSYVDRPCGTDLSNLWLDVIAVVATNILSVFSSGTRIGSDPVEPRTTRLGLVTYNSNATRQADLNQYQSYFDANNGIFDALSTAVDTDESYLATELELAEQMFNDQSVNTTRGHYKRVVIVYASEYKGDGELDPLPIATRLKLSAVNIITIAYQQPGSVGLLNYLNQIASPGFSFSDEDSERGILGGKIQSALLQSNCFCSDGWIQYRETYSDPASSRYGVCIQAVNIPASWLSAKMSCINRNSSLATEFSQDKHDFILSVVQNTQGFSLPYRYHIGLNYVSASWVWAQPTGRQQVPLQQPFMWLSGYPQMATSQSAVMNIQSGHGTGWIRIAKMTGTANYVCETYSCDTDNYCDENMIKQQ